MEGKQARSSLDLFVRGFLCTSDPCSALRNDRRKETRRPQILLSCVWLIFGFRFLEKKGRGPRGSPPLWYTTVEELSSLSSYMRRSLTLEKVNAAINDMASYAEANAHPISAPKQKVSLTYTMFIGLGVWLINNTTISLFKLNNTGKAILTVLRHLGRVSETRIGQNRVIILRNQIKFVSFHIVRGSGSLHHLGSLLLR
ncbi:BnaC04g22070D [Brassica napus]|uniref:BnaC04g22070D protein n=1 Tax=Brassica napus TaxID=3708 RepID=A0A078IGU2_BRANA|nr:BnaC04g22070D [Brassica napus]